MIDICGERWRMIGLLSFMLPSTGLLQCAIAPHTIKIRGWKYFIITPPFYHFTTEHNWGWMTKENLGGLCPGSNRLNLVSSCLKERETWFVVFLPSLFCRRDDHPALRCGGQVWYHDRTCLSSKTPGWPCRKQTITPLRPGHSLSSKILNCTNSAQILRKYCTNIILNIAQYCFRYC